MSPSNDNPHLMTDAELADIKRNWTLTVGDWRYMTPTQKIADIVEFWAHLWRLEGNINRLDLNDPANARVSIEDVELSE